MTKDHIVIREAIEQDLDAIVRIINAGGPGGKQREDLPVVLPLKYRRAFEAINVESNSLLMVAEWNNLIVGTFQLIFVTYLAGGGRPDAHIEAIHVVSNHRGKGIGTQMLAWAIDESKRRNCRRIQLTSDKQRPEAHRFYIQSGFSLSHEGAKLYL